MGQGTDAMKGGDRTDEIRRDIDRTQREMSRTIDEIQQRLSPHHMMQRTKNSMREAGVNASRSFMDKVRDNPIPAAMVGVGMFLLMRDRDSWDASDRQYSSVAEYRDLEYEAGGRLAEARERASHLADETRERASHLADRARSLGSTARDRMESAGRHSRDVFTDNPMVAGLTALAVGALLGALIPETEKEHELMGASRDRVAERARDLAREGASRARDLATTATHAATEAVKSEVKGQPKDDIGQPVGIPT